MSPSDLDKVENRIKAIGGTPHLVIVTSKPNIEECDEEERYVWEALTRKIIRIRAYVSMLQGKLE